MVVSKKNNSVNMALAFFFWLTFFWGEQIEASEIARNQKGGGGDGGGHVTVQQKCPSSKDQHVHTTVALQRLPSHTDGNHLIKALWRLAVCHFPLHNNFKLERMINKLSKNIVSNMVSGSSSIDFLSGIYSNTIHPKQGHGL